MPTKLKSYRPIWKGKHKPTPDRPSSCKRGYGRSWRKVRLAVLAESPLCLDCMERGKLSAATEVDHVDGDVYNLERRNLRASCKSCHSAKTCRENGGLGSARR